MKTASRSSALVRTYFAVGAAISLLAIIQTQYQTQALLKLATRYKWALLIALLAVNACVGLFIALRSSGWALDWPKSKSLQRPAAWLAGAVLFVGAVPVYLIARTDFFGNGPEGFFRLLWLFWWLVLIQTAGVRLVLSWDLSRSFLGALLIDGLAAQLYTLSTGVSAYPFSIGWSEASRYYYGSLVFSKAVYGQELPLSVMHGTRYLLQSIPFLAGQVPLWSARLWQVLLWVGLTSASAWALVRRLRMRERTDAFLVLTWLFLCFFQGAVYYHLHVCVIAVLVGVDMRRPGRSLAAIALASLWAGMSRVNWFAVPALLAMGLYLLEAPYARRTSIWSYARTPVIWGAAGLISSLAGQAFYVAVSGNQNLEAFASSFTSALLWYRWWPSATNSIGIIPGVLIVSAPVLAIILWRLRSDAPGLHWLRLAGLTVIGAVLLAAGLVVSTKIGGGGDLHNMDAYLVFLAILGMYCLKGRVQLEGKTRGEGGQAPWSILVVMVVVPVALALLRLGNAYAYDAVRATADLRALGSEVQAKAVQGEVLFMYERHLQTFGLVPLVEVVPEYEVLTLMEMAISGNQAYLSRFYDDLAAHRFSAIVAHPQNLGVETGDFIEENNSWSQWIAKPLLCQYKPALTLEYSRVQILVPRERPCADYPPSFGSR